jgi:endonuclease YncB( thermonuclease family)
MFASAFTSGSKDRRGEIILLLAMLSAAAPLGCVRAEGCAFAPQGEGRVAEIVDGRSFRLTDGREIRLAGVEPVRPIPGVIDGTAILTGILAGQDVTLRGADDAPDRYGRQTAFVFLASSDALVQSMLLAEGAALVSADIADKGCEGILMQSEAEARKVKKGLWNAPGVIKTRKFLTIFWPGLGNSL